MIRLSLDKTPYELWKNKKPNISYFKVFGSKCFILNTKDNLGEFDAKSNVGIFPGYSSSSKAYKKTMVVVVVPSCYSFLTLNYLNFNLVSFIASA